MSPQVKEMKIIGVGQKCKASTTTRTATLQIRDTLSHIVLN